MSEEYPHYSMIIEWSVEDQAYIVTVPELPGCRTHGASYIDAAQHGQEALEGWVDVARAQGETLPSVRHFAQR